MTEQSQRTSTPKVSVLMPVYRTPEIYLREAVESILKQTFTDFEFLILDDCPEHPVADIVNSYADERIKYVQNAKNMGISASRNQLMDMAQGAYLAVLDHDDVALPERLAKEVAFLDTHPEVGVVGTWYETFPKIKLKKKYVLNSQIEKDLMYNCSILHPSAMIRKAVLTENHLRYEAEFSPAEDYMLWGRLIGKTKFANIPEVLQKYRKSATNTSKLQADKIEVAAQKIRRLLQQEHPDLARRATDKQILPVCGLPLVERQNKGCTLKYKWLGLFKTTASEPILTFDTSRLPIYIICYNRLSYLQKIIARLEQFGLHNIHIIDNCSSYPPLLEYLQQTPYTVHRMDKNYGHMVFFLADEFKSVRENEYYVLTDPDVIATEECPADFLDYFYYLLQQYPQVSKVGFALKMDDVPNTSRLWEMMRRWESQYYKKKLNWFKPYWYKSYIDTTFALYRPQKTFDKNRFYKAIRVGAPYEARHFPWYKDVSCLDEEDKFYAATDCGSGNWNDEAGIARIKEAMASKMVDHWWEHIFSVKTARNRQIVRLLGLKFTRKNKAQKKC